MAGKSIPLIVKNWRLEIVNNRLYLHEEIIFKREYVGKNEDGRRMWGYNGKPWTNAPIEQHIYGPITGIKNLKRFVKEGFKKSCVIAVGDILYELCLREQKHFRDQEVYEFIVNNVPEI